MVDLFGGGGGKANDPGVEGLGDRERMRSARPIATLGSCRFRWRSWRDVARWSLGVDMKDRRRSERKRRKVGKQLYFAQGGYCIKNKRKYLEPRLTRRGKWLFRHRGSSSSAGDLGKEQLLGAPRCWRCRWTALAAASRIGVGEEGRLCYAEGRLNVGLVHVLAISRNAVNCRWLQT